jgi:hypothetical protein
MSFRAAAALMIGVVCLASISPAVAATRVDPIEVIKANSGLLKPAFSNSRHRECASVSTS